MKLKNLIPRISMKLGRLKKKIIPDQLKPLFKSQKTKLNLCAESNIIKL